MPLHLPCICHEESWNGQTGLSHPAQPTCSSKIHAHLHHKITLSSPHIHQKIHIMSENKYIHKTDDWRQPTKTDRRHRPQRLMTEDTGHKDWWQKAQATKTDDRRRKPQRLTTEDTAHKDWQKTQATETDVRRHRPKIYDRRHRPQRFMSEDTGHKDLCQKTQATKIYDRRRRP